METEYKKPELSQISFLSQQIQRDENLVKHFDMAKPWELLDNGLKSVKQYKYILYLLAEKKYIKLNGIMLQFGFKRNLIN